MSKLVELIAELCPDGVEYKSLDEVSNYSSSRIEATDVDASSYVGVDNLLPDKKGKIDSSYVPTEGRLTQFSEGDILIGNIRPYLKKIWLATHEGGTNGDVLVIQIKDRKTLSSEYLFYALSSDQFFIYDVQNSKGAKMPRGDKASVMKYHIPLPPLPVQQEIVRILDNFTELTARRKQYEYYRNRLLTFGDDVPMMALGETCLMKSGKAISSSQISTQKDENTPFGCFGGNGIRGYVKDASHHGEFPLIGRQGALCGNVNYATGNFYATEHAVVVKSRGQFNQRFLFYLLTSMNLNQYKSQGAQPGLAVGNLENLIAPVPPLDKQQRIVAILDRFDALCNDLTSGLPAEIEARRKQYEYYRDKLLTFKEASA
jgi:type I restriction enzyme S subunit